MAKKSRRGRCKRPRAERIERWRKTNVFGSNLTRLREKNGMTVEDLADDTGIGQSLIIKWEQGLHVSSVYEVLYLAKFFDVDINKLLK